VAILGERFPVGSSNNITLGVRTRAIAIVNICLSPPLKFPAFDPSYPTSWGKRVRTSSTLFFRSALSTVFFRHPKVISHRQVREDVLSLREVCEPQLCYLVRRHPHEKPSATLSRSRLSVITRLPMKDKPPAEDSSTQEPC
jgi:hypothetical protein